MNKFIFVVDPTNPELKPIHPIAVNQKTHYLRAFFEKIEKGFRDESILLWEECRLENERTKDHEDDSEYDYRASDSLREIEFVYLRMHRYSATLANYAYLESSMMKLCKELEVLTAPSIVFTPGNNGGVEKCRDYFKKVTGEDFSKINSSWCQIITLNKIRNCIIHANGDSSRMRNKEEIIKIIEKSQDLSFIEDNLLMISSEFIQRSIDNIKIILNHMYNTKNLKAI